MLPRADREIWLTLRQQASARSWPHHRRTAVKNILHACMQAGAAGRAYVFRRIDLNASTHDGWVAIYGSDVCWHGTAASCIMITCDRDANADTAVDGHICMCRMTSDDRTHDSKSTPGRHRVNNGTDGIPPGGGQGFVRCMCLISGTRTDMASQREAEAAERQEISDTQRQSN